MTETRQISVNAMTRVEGEGALRVRVRGETIEDLQLAIYEPPRFFEPLLRGRKIEEVPDITARICGICPVAYQMTSVQAIESALGVVISPSIQLLRQLLYWAEWIESHALHVFLLNAPDFFQCQSGIELAKRFPNRINDGLRIKKIANALLATVGGRAVHPINIRVGGFYRVPPRDSLTKLLPDLRWALDAAIDSTHWIASFDFPSFDIDCEMVALHNETGYAIMNGVLASTHHPSIAIEDYPLHFEERQVPHSTALHSVRTVTQSPYFVGPLARLTLNHKQLAPLARKLWEEVAPRDPLRNRFHSIIARIIEIVHALEESICRIDDYSPTAESFVSYNAVASAGCSATEAPRGLIYHRYEIDDRGLVVSAKIVPPTSQNQFQMETDLRAFLPGLLHTPDEVIADACERLIRTYDPCISCSTHFLKLQLERT